MPIKITKGNKIYPGRVTTPKGTFLGDPITPFSNPSTAAAGGLGAGGGTLPATPQIGTPYNPFSPVVNAMQQVWSGLKRTSEVNVVLPSLTNEQVAEKYGPWAGNYVQAFRDIQNGLTTPQTQSTGSFVPRPTSPTSSYVGSDLVTSPNEIAGRQIQQLFPNMSATDIAKTMSLKGYERRYQMGVGEIWVKVAESAPAKNLQNTPGTRPDYVDAASLERGERVTSSSGISFVGGADYTNEAGETVSQYAMTRPGGPKAGEDKHGDYKWVSTTQQDSDGNWVRIYRQELRKVKTRSGLRRIAAGQETAQSAQNPAVTGGSHNTQLVTLRADYG